MTKYLVICKKCKGQNEIGLTKSNQVLWITERPIISARQRLDGNWGFQCQACNANDILTEQEKKNIKDPSKPEEREIQDILNNLKVQPMMFKMVRI